jgi:hypothetical protein
LKRGSRRAPRHGEFKEHSHEPWFSLDTDVRESFCDRRQLKW